MSSEISSQNGATPFPWKALFLGIALGLVILAILLILWPTPVPQPPVAVGPTELTVVMHDTYYGDSDNNATNPPTWEAPAGSNVLLNIENLGKLDHNWAIVKTGMTPPMPYQGGQDHELIWYGAGMVYGSNKTTVTFAAPQEPGDYLVICTVENHYPLMQGRLHVK